MNFYNSDSIDKLKGEVKKAPSGFNFGYANNLFKDEVYAELIKTFPNVSKFKFVDKMSGGGHKRFYVGPVYTSGTHLGCVCHMENLPEIWKKVIQESASPEFMEMLSEASGVKFNSLCNFGFAYGNEGCRQEAHIDGAVREEEYGQHRSTIALLLYFNEKEGGSSGTCVYGTDRKTVLFQAPGLRNSMAFFEQHTDAWHGFPTVPAGEDRRVISLSYSLEKDPIVLKTSWGHKLTCKRRLKDFAKKILKR